MMNRRGFFQRILGGAAAAALARHFPKFEVLPSPPLVQAAEIDQITTANIQPGIIDDFFKADPLLAYMKGRQLGKVQGGPAIQANFLYKAPAPSYEELEHAYQSCVIGNWPYPGPWVTADDDDDWEDEC